MSSMMSYHAKKLVLIAGCVCAASVAVNAALPVSEPMASPTQILAPAPKPALSDDQSQTLSAISLWTVLRRSGDQPFSTYANFLTANRGWPGELALRRNAERALDASAQNPETIIAYFRKLAPLSATSWLSFAEALRSNGQTEEATSAARKAWTSGPLSFDNETRLLDKFGSVMRTEDHDRRMDMLLWTRSTVSASRQLAFVSAGTRLLFSARLALVTQAGDSSSEITSVGETPRSNPGFLFDYIFWLRKTGQSDVASALLADAKPKSDVPWSPGTWLELRLSFARAAISKGDWPTAYDIARQADDAYAPGTIVRERSFGERDAYTDLVWLAGTTALSRLNRPADAQAMFERYAAAAKSAQTRAKGLFWAGKAAELAGKQQEATAIFEQAAQYYDQFHGQMASERLGRKPIVPATDRVIDVSGAERQAFNQKSVVKALVLLGQQGNWQDQSLFVRSLSLSLVSDAEHVLATELAGQINRTDLSVLAGKNAKNLGLTGYTLASFPKQEIPVEHLGNWTMIHAITRQESQFDRRATSPVGARGLMQLMPGTARETAKAAGLPYDYSQLIDPKYNIALGATYFGQLMDIYGGNYVLSVAAYNAGPGNVNKWIRANGDPRTGMDILTWIDAIPLSETRNYVQRVLENAVVYDQLNPTRRQPTTLAALLGTTPSSYARQ